MSGTRVHWVHRVQRISAAVLGAGLLVFAALGFSGRPPFFSTTGQTVLGLSNNGALSALSVAAGILLLAGAAVGGKPASTVSIGMGAAFLVSGLVHLAILHTSWNIFAFRLSNVFFSLVAGLLLLIFGFYGRVTGGLPPDNPYRRAHPVRHDRPDPDEQLRANGSQSYPEDQSLLDAELAMGEGRATPGQEAMVRRDHARKQAEERSRAYRAVQRRVREEPE
ncbi:DUF4383 domain-containing protein [Parasphingorhabdus pacifica]